MRRSISSVLVVMAGILVWSPETEAANSVVVVDTDAVFSATSLELDTTDHPVIAYYDSASVDLQLVHCNDPNCAGGEESIVTVDSVGDVGSNASLALDAADNPVVSYYDATNGHLKVAHCNDPNCAGGDESIVAVDRAGTVGVFTSLALDAAGNPVISYYDFGNFDLKLAHCNDANCAGGDETIVAVDEAGDVGSDSSLALDAAGNPVVSYHDAGELDLKLAHCNDPNCFGGDESIVTVDSAGRVGRTTSLTLDAAGNPVVGYHDFGTLQLKAAHCNEPNCAGGDESIVSVDSSAGSTSLELDAIGNPVVSYQDGTNTSLKVVHCNDVDCAGADEPIFTVDSEGRVGLDTSLELDNRGNPVVSYRDWSNEDLKLAHCDNTVCSPATCSGAGATIVGTAGADVINGTAGADVIAAGDGDDRINGLAGDDLVCGGDGTDTIDGGDGNDELFGFANGTSSDAGDTIDGGEGNDWLDGGGPGDDRLAGGSGDDRLLGGEADSDDVLDGGPGADTLNGEGGLDTASYASSAAAIAANLTTGSATGDGTDELFAVENLVGSPFADTLVGDPGPNTIQGLDGNDGLDGSAGVDTVSYVASANVSVNLATGTAAGDGNDTLSRFEDVVGSPFSDTIVGDSGANTIRGLAGVDGLDGAGGDDRAIGDDDNDIIFGSTGNDVINGGAGLDTLNFARSTGGIRVDLSTGTVTGEGADRLTGIEDVVGSEFDDVLRGNAASNSLAGAGGEDLIAGGAGDDFLFGDDGADRITGDPGNDRIVSGAGNDVLAGGPGYDRLSGETGVDTVTYAGAAVGVSVSLRTRGASGEGIDVLAGFENVVGSRFPDALTGNEAANRLQGGPGNDSLRGRGGNDALDGGLGADTVSFSSSVRAVRADLTAGTAVGDGSDRLSGLENAVGSRFGDVLTGHAGANSIRGGGGNDRLWGAAGNDALNCGNEFDRGDGGLGRDTQRRCEVIAGIP